MFKHLRIHFEKNNYSDEQRTATLYVYLRFPPYFQGNGFSHKTYITERLYVLNGYNKQFIV